MFNKHFFKTLTTFSIIIILGLVVVFLVAYFGEGGEGASAETVAN